MNNFGVVELAGAAQPANRKRARNGPGARLSLGDLSARQEAKTRKEIEALDRDGGRDSAMPLPVRGGRGQAKHTANVRKIMQSQKTFANHLDDFLALQALAEATTPAVPGPSGAKRPAAAAAAAAAGNGNKRDRQPPADATSVADADVARATGEAEQAAALPGGGDDDDDALLASRVPEAPSDEELRTLLAHPPLTYLEARGTCDDGYPVRVFCEVCGYWGRVRCIKCGTRVCALDCLEMHREECVTRYGL